MYRVGRITRGLVLGWLADKSLSVSESDVGRRYVMTHVVLNDLDLVFAPYSDARVCCPQIDTDDADDRPSSLIIAANSGLCRVDSHKVRRHIKATTMNNSKNK